MSFYTSTILPLAFRLDAERAHHLAIGAGAMMRPFARALYRLNAIEDPRLETVIAGLRFPTPLGLAAGPRSRHSPVWVSVLSKSVLFPSIHRRAIRALACSGCRKIALSLYIMAYRMTVRVRSSSACRISICRYRSASIL